MRNKAGECNGQCTQTCTITPIKLDTCAGLPGDISLDALPGQSSLCCPLFSVVCVCVCTVCVCVCEGVRACTMCLRDRERDRQTDRETDRQTDRVQRCFTSTETIRSITDGEPRTTTTTLTKFLSSDPRSLKQGKSWLYNLLQPLGYSAY